jgi:hypothetical protein
MRDFVVDAFRVGIHKALTKEAIKHPHTGLELARRPAVGGTPSGVVDRDRAPTAGEGSAVGFAVLVFLRLDVVDSGLALGCAAPLDAEDCMRKDNRSQSCKLHAILTRSRRTKRVDQTCTPWPLQHASDSEHPAHAHNEMTAHPRTGQVCPP